jgi:hypothetical protein
MGIYEDIKNKDFKTKDIPHGSIQWKGTKVCIDLYCKCGHHGHVDTDFFYWYECPQCHAKYAVGSTVKLIKLNQEQIDHVNAGFGFTTCDLEDEE